MIKKKYIDKNGNEKHWEYEKGDKVSYNDQLSDDLENTRKEWAKEGFEVFKKVKAMKELPLGVYVKYITKTKDGDKARSGGALTKITDKYIMLLNVINQRGWSVQFDNIVELWVKASPKMKVEVKPEKVEKDEEPTEPPEPEVPENEVDKIMKDFYYKQENFFGAEKLYKRLKEEYPDKKITRNQVREWLSKQELYQVFKNNKSKTEMRALVPKKALNLVYIDMIDYSKNPNKKGDNTYKYLLTAVDGFSKYGWAVPLKNKKPADYIQGLKDILNDPILSRQFKGVLSDNEFKNAEFHSFLRNRGITAVHSLPYNPNSNKAEVFNKTLKTYLAYQYKKNGEEIGKGHWIDYIDKAVKNYNKNIHTTIKVAPIDALLNPQLEAKIYQRLKNVTKTIPDDGVPLNVGNKVRLSEWQNVIQAKGKNKYTDEIFTIYKRIGKRGLRPVRYLVKDKDGEAITGEFTANDLLFVPEDTFTIEEANKL